MKNFKITNIFENKLSSTSIINLGIYLLIILISTLILSSKYFLLQNLADKDNISKKDVVATRTIEIVDTFKTEQQKKEAASKIEPILTTAEDNYIKNNLLFLLSSIDDIRAKKVPMSQKKDELGVLFDISDPSLRNFAVSFFLHADKKTVDATTQKTTNVLSAALEQGISEKDLDKQNIAKIVMRYTDHNVTKNQISIISALIHQVIAPNMIVDESATELARKNAANAISPHIVKVEKGEKIVFDGEHITKLKRDALAKAGYNVLELNYIGFFCIFFLNAIGFLSLFYYLQHFEKPFLNRNYITLMVILSFALMVSSIFLSNNLSLYWIPFPAFAIILAVFTNPRVSYLSSILLITIISLSLRFDAAALAIFIIVSLVSTVSVARIKYSRRFDLVKIGFEISVVIGILITSVYFLETCVTDIGVEVLFKDLMAGVLMGILSGVIALGLLPILESLFKIITPYGLAELADHNQPLLKRLQFEAPGTFSHCLMLSNLCEAAAEAIGADPILARVGAFYHDIGKLKRPLFFVENQTYYGIENPHTKLNPRLSKMVITAHPKDGLELAKEYGIPPVIQNFISQHHGDSIASYFYNQALKEEGADNVTQEQFRYPGPKPNTKETAILMLADAVESASRTLTDHSQESINALVDRLIKDRLNDGQLSDSPLTLKDLKIIATTFSRVLRAAHHQRIKYHQNIIEELENKSKQSSENQLYLSKVANTELEEKIEKKIQKRQQKKNNEKD